MSLEELIKNKLCLDESRGCDDGAVSDYRSNERGGGGGGGPMRQDRQIARRLRRSVTQSGYSVVHSPRIPVTPDENGRRQPRFGYPNNRVRKIVVSNLNYRVTSAKIRRIFDEFGPLKSAALRFDKFGRSLGKADVVFDSTGAAWRAKQRYDNARLSGRFMRIKLAAGSSNVPTRFRTSLAGAARERYRGDDGARGNYRGDRRGRNGARRIMTPSVDELDTQLDTYMGRTE